MPNIKNLVFIAIGIASILMMSLKTPTAFKEHQTTTQTVVLKFSEINGLSVGSKVKYLGMNIGKIQNINLRLDHIEVHLELRKDFNYSPELEYSIEDESILHGKYILFHTQSQIGHFDGERKYNDINTAIKRFAKTAADVSELSKNINEKIVDRNGKEIGEVLENTNKVMKEFGAMLKDNRENIDESFKNIREITNDAKNSLKKINKFIEKYEKSSLLLEVNAGYLSNFETENAVTSNFFVHYQPNPTKYYSIGVENVFDSPENAEYLFHLLYNFKVEDNVFSFGLINNDGGIKYKRTLGDFLIEGELYNLDGNDVYEHPKLDLSASWQTEHGNTKYRATIYYNNALNRHGSFIGFGVGMLFEDSDLVTPLMSVGGIAQ